MNNNETLKELLSILIDECDGLQHASSQMLRYGDSKYIDDLEKGLGAILAMIKLLDEEIKINQNNLLSYSDDKIVEVERFLNSYIR